MVIIPKGFEHDCLNSFGTIGKGRFFKLCHAIRLYWILFTGIGVVGGFAIAYQIISTILNILKYINP